GFIRPSWTRSRSTQPTTCWSTWPRPLAFIVSSVYAPELLQAAEAPDDERLDPGDLAELLALGARINARIGGDDDAMTAFASARHPPRAATFDSRTISGYSICSTMLQRCASLPSS